MNKMKKTKKVSSLMLATAMAVSSVSSAAMAEETEGKKYEVVENAGGFNQVIQEGGKKLSYSPESGVTLLEDDGFAFKDLNQNGELDTYEDWRLDAKTRAQALADLMVADGRDGIESIAGLMQIGRASCRERV